jgi:hypothetical protein
LSKSQLKLMRDFDQMVPKAETWIKDVGNPTTAVEEHCIRAEAIPKGVVDCIQERMPV